MIKVLYSHLHKNKTSKKNGFTLVELVIVIAVLAIIVAIAIPTINGVIKNANDTANDSNAAALEMTFKAFRSEYEARATFPLSSEKAALNKDSTAQDLLSAYGVTLPEVRITKWVYTAGPVYFIWDKENSTVTHGITSNEPDGSESTRLRAIVARQPLSKYFDWLE